MIGYKVFNKDWTCRSFQYKVGGIYEIEERPKCCKIGFHFCKRLKYCFSYYDFSPNNKVAIVEALGVVDENHVDSKVCTNKIKIVEELTWNDVLDLVNIGDDNTGQGNVGDNNSGNYNVGCCNTGNNNTGNCNSGHGNSGYNNSGVSNARDNNTGNNNTGSFNSGHFNSGDFNSGYNNTGDFNLGCDNTGFDNLGCKNAGDSNIGSWNTGDNNIGSHNTGDFNLGDWNTGCFNTKEQKIFMFDKEANITYKKWRESNARHILNKMPINKLIWVKECKMTEEDKEYNPAYKVTRGCLKRVDVSSEEKQEWYNNLKEEDKLEIKSIPNFDSDIFKEITGIDVTGS